MPIDLTIVSLSDLKIMKKELEECMQNTRSNIIVAETEEDTMHFEALAATYQKNYNMIQQEINNRLK